MVNLSLLIHLMEYPHYRLHILLIWHAQTNAVGSHAVKTSSRYNPEPRPCESLRKLKIRPLMLQQ